MADEVKKIITIEVNGDQTVKSLKQEINDLRDALLNTEEGSEEYKKVLEQLIEDQKKLTSVMSVGKKEVEAAAGSYNALQNEMTALKKVWREVSDEASRNEIAGRINELNNQLKDMDATIGNHQRNVGNYTQSWIDAGLQMSGSFGKMNSVLRTIMVSTRNLTKEMAKLTAQQKAYNAAAATTNGNLNAMGQAGGNAAKGLGKAGSAAKSLGPYVMLAVMAISLIISHWEDLLNIMEKISPKFKAKTKEINDLTDANKRLLEVTEAVNSNVEFNARIMEAQGKSTKEVLEYKRMETEALLENIKAQVAETEAKLASLKAHTWWQRTFSNDKKHIKQLEESLEELKSTEEEYSKTVLRLTQDLIINDIKTEKERTDAAKNGAKDRVQIEKITSKDRLAVIQGFVNEAKKLEEKLYTDEEKIVKEFADNQNTLVNGLFGNIVQSIRRRNLPDEIKKQLSSINLGDLPDKVKKQVNDVVEALDFTKSDIELTNSLRQSLGSILPDNLKESINSIDIKSISDELIDKIQDTINSSSVNGSISVLKEMFADDNELQGILDSFTTLWTRVEAENDKRVKENEEKNKKANAEKVKNNLSALEQDKANKLAFFKEEMETEKEKAREVLDTEKATYEDKKLLRQAEYEADKRYSDMEIQVLQDELDAYRKAVADEKLDDETLLAFKQEITDREIELIRKLREERDKEREKQKEDAADEKAEMQEKLDMYLQFANAVASVLGSVADYWAETLNAQVENGEKSEAQAEKEFKWIKGLQIAEATINTIAGAIGAYMKAAETYVAPWGTIIGATQAAAITAAGVAQIAKIKNTQFSKSNSSTPISSGSQVRTITTDYTPQYVAAETGASETTNLANAMSQQNIFVSVVDINRVQNKVRVREEESTF